MRVGILSPGDMGAAIGRVLGECGAEVSTSLEGRSELTRERAAEAGIRDAGSFEALVTGTDVILSVLVPSEATAVAERVAGAIKSTGARPVFVECNAISPRSVQKIGAVITAAGGGFIDAGIIGGPPRAPNAGARFVCSAPDTTAFEALKDFGLNVVPVGKEIGDASGLKMLYAASTKGTTAVWTELLVAARALGLGEALARELEGSRVGQSVMPGIPSMPRRSRRWVGEMEEIAATFADAGLTPRIFEGAADLYRFIGATPLGDLTERDANPSLDEVLTELARRLPAE
jgi:3-hydroxyisobutyrate dehydrogenase-like beta-hydroxyacid dehydrogenase